MTRPDKTLIAFSTRWGAQFGGVNSFNQDLLSAFAAAAFREARTICVVLDADAKQIEIALSEQVQLVSIGRRDDKAFSPAFEPEVWQALSAAKLDFDVGQTIWLGHDRITGGIANAAAKERGGKSAVIHHMSYSRYEDFAENSALADQKVKEQKRLFTDANIVLAVGPLLRDALREMQEKDVAMLVPGLPEITAKRTPATFKAFLSGRLSADARKIKQAHLGIAAFGDAIRQADANSGLPDSLRGENEPELTLRGVDFENVNGEQNAEAEQNLRLFAEKYAGRVFPLRALPFTTERTVLFDDLRSASVAMMPSWHEGFGLVAWEAIAAGVPLIVSNKSGAFRLLRELEEGRYVSWVKSIDVLGSHVDPFFKDEDLDKLAQALIAVAKDPDAARKKATMLREELHGRFTWAHCAHQLAAALGWPVSGSDVSSPVNREDENTQQPAPQLFACSLLELPAPTWHPHLGLSDSALLRAEESIVPFDANREPFLDEQLAWARSNEHPISIRLLTGPGGVGKTRLALELCHRLRADAWEAGFLRGDREANPSIELSRQIASADREACVVIDYAETRQTALLSLLKSLQAARLKKRVRILLLARDGGEWWNLLASKDAACEALLDGSASSGPILLPKLHDSESDRQAAYRLALKTFADQLGISFPANVPTLNEAHFAYPLYVQMAALMALHGERPKSAEALPRALVNHERRYWRKALAELNHDANVVEQQAALMMTLATLANGISTTSDIEKVWVAADGEKPLMKRLLTTLSPLYAGRQGLEPLRPDLLGEALVAQTLLSPVGQAMLRSALSEGSLNLRRSTLTVLARLLRNRVDLIPVVEDTLVETFLACATDLVAVCIETPSPLPQVVERAFTRLSSQHQSQAAGTLDRHLVDDVLPLAGLDVLVSKTLRDKAEKKLKKNDPVTMAAFAKALGDLSVALNRNGKSEAAMESVQHAETLMRVLAKSHPERFEQDWAHMLKNYAGDLTRHGKFAEAIDASGQAVAILRRLAKSGTGQLDLELASALHNHGVALTLTHRSGEALASTEDALNLRRNPPKLPKHRIDSDLAGTLGNYALILCANGRHDAALEAVTEATGILRELVRAKPARFESAWSLSLVVYGECLANNGRYEEALSASGEALNNFQKLAHANPVRFDPSLVDALERHAFLAASVGDWNSAIGSANLALAGARRCASRTPGSHAHIVERAALSLALFHWLAGNRQGVLDSQAVHIEDARGRKTIEFIQNCLAPYIDGDTCAVDQAIERALQYWNGMDTVQKYEVVNYHILIGALADHRSGQSPAFDDFRTELTRFRQQRQGRLPVWMVEAARRAGITL